MNFLNDWAALQHTQLVKAGVMPPSRLDNQEISFAYWNAKRRHIEPLPRRVLFADDFHCPLERQAVLATLASKFESGNDVTPYLSGAIEDANNPNFDDRLLNDWDIHHFHLGEANSKKPFGRSRELLFAKITQATALCITVRDHGAWSTTALLESIHRNWPEAIADWIAPGVFDLDPVFSDDDIALLRGKGGKKPRTALSYLTQMSDGTVYIPPGGGYTASGLSTRVLDTSNFYCNRIVAMQKHVEQNSEKLISTIRQHGFVASDPFVWKLEIHQGIAFVRDEAATVRLKLEPFVPLGVSAWIYRPWFISNAEPEPVA